MSGEVCWINRHFEGPELFVFVLGVTHTGTSQKSRIWWKSSFFHVAYFKKWNFHIFRFITCKEKHFKSCFVLMCMVGAYSSWNKKISISKYLNLSFNNKLSADKLYGDADFISQQDLAPAHTAKDNKSWFNDLGVTVLDWPANLPDLNPRKNLWGIMSTEICCSCFVFVSLLGREVKELVVCSATVCFEGILMTFASEHLCKCLNGPFIKSH